MMMIAIMIALVIITTIIIIIIIIVFVSIEGKKTVTAKALTTFGCSYSPPIQTVSVSRSK